MSSSGENLEKYLIPLDEINRATDNFSDKKFLGRGGFGSVYRGQLSEHWESRMVAVKRLDADSFQGEREFRNELQMFSRCHHENIIAFIGYCDQRGVMIIVYEYASNGSLDHHLQYPNKMNRITWAQRLEICIGAARGLHYLHSGLGEKNRVIHRDVKSANILLDGNMIAKICDFGLSKLGTKNQPGSRIYTKVAGTPFYIDPIYHESGILRKESDVYSLGVVLFEILSGMLVYHKRRIRGEIQSLMNAVRRYDHNEPDNVVDSCIRDQMYGGSFDTFIKIAYECISLTLKERPTLDTVIKKLEEALVIQISEDSYSTPADGSMIESIIGMLNSFSTYNQLIASIKIRRFTEHWDENRVAFGQAGAIPGLTQLLTAPDSQTQEHAITALLNLAREDDNKRIIISSGAVPGIVHLLEKGSNEARETAADVIFYLSAIDEADVPIGSAGVIPPLVLLLSEDTTTTTGKKIAAKSLANLCIDYDNKGTAIRAGAVPIVMELLSEPQGVLKEESVQFLARLSRHPEGRLAIGEAEAVPHLVEVIGSGSHSCDADAVTVLVKICSMYRKYLVQVQEHGVMGKLKYVRQHGTDEGKIKARELWRMITDHQHVDYGSDNEIYEHSASTPAANGSIIESVTGKLNSANPYNQRLASGEIALLTDIPENRVAFAKAGAIPQLTNLLTSPDSQTQEHTVTALLNLSLYEDNRGIIISSGAVPGLVNILEKCSDEVRENAAAAIGHLFLKHEAIGTIDSGGAVPPLVLLLSEGTPRGKKIAANALNVLCHNDDNRGRAVRAGAVPILMELLTEPQGVLKEDSVELLYRLSRHPEGKLAIGEAEAVPHLVEVIGSGSHNCDVDAVTVLLNLCSLDEKYLVDAQEHGVMRKLKDLRQHGIDMGKIKARRLRRIIKDHQHVDHGSDNEIDNE